VAQRGIGKQLAEGERNQAESKRKACKTKEKLPEGVKRTQPGTNKPQKPPQLETDESETKEEKPVCNDPTIGSYNNYHLSPNGIPSGNQRWYSLVYK